MSAARDSLCECADPTCVRMREALEIICSRGVPAGNLTPYGAVRSVAAFAIGKTDDPFYRDGERLFNAAKEAQVV